MEKMSEVHEPPLWRASRRLHGPIGRRVYTREGEKLILYAYQKGMPPAVTPNAWDFAPAIFGVGQYIYLYLRYRIRYKGAYILDIREPGSTASLAIKEFDSRAQALEELEQVTFRLKSLTRAAVAGAFAPPPDAPE